MSPIHRPEGLRGDLKISEMTAEEHSETMLKLLFHIRQQNIRTNRQLFDYSRPVEEYFNAPDPVAAGEYEIQPNYSMPSRIEGVFASLPIGITNAVLTLGRERTIPLYNGAATTAQTIVSIRDAGFMVTENDRRTIVFTGNMTSGFFVGLFGWAWEWAGNG